MKFHIYGKPPIQELEFIHDCAIATCDEKVRYDDEPYCFKHSPDSGSSFPGYSAQRAQLEHSFGVIDMHTEFMLNMRQQILESIPEEARNVSENLSHAAALQFFLDELVHDLTKVREHLSKVIKEEPIDRQIPVLNA